MNVMDLFKTLDGDLPLSAVQVAVMNTYDDGMDMAAKDTGSFMLYVTTDAYTAQSYAVILYQGANDDRAKIFTSDVDGSARNIPFTSPGDMGNAYKLLADIVSQSL